MSLQFRIKYSVIVNDHCGNCSGNECDEYENHELSYDKIVNIPVEFFKNGDDLILKGLYTQGPIFDMISEEYNYSRDICDSYSYFCENGSTRFDIHTTNFIVKSVEFLGQI